MGVHVCDSVNATRVQGGGRGVVAGDSVKWAGAGAGSSLPAGVGETFQSHCREQWPWTVILGAEATASAENLSHKTDRMTWQMTVSDQINYSFHFTWCGEASFKPHPQAHLQALAERIWL